MKKVVFVSLLMAVAAVTSCNKNAGSSEQAPLPADTVWLSDTTAVAPDSVWVIDGEVVDGASQHVTVKTANGDTLECQYPENLEATQRDEYEIGDKVRVTVKSEGDVEYSVQELRVVK